MTAPSPRFRALLLCAAAASLALHAAPTLAESGFYLGSGVGVSSVQADVAPLEELDLLDFDETDLAWKVFAGYNLDVPFVDVAVEGGYVNLGAPSAEILDTNISLDTTGWNAFAVGAVDVGPIALFGKVGVVAWDVELSGEGISAGSDDGTDLAFGLGARFGLGPIQLRGEAEFFQIDVIDDSYLLTASLIWQF